MKKLLILALALIMLTALSVACTHTGGDTDTTIGETSPEVTADITAEVTAEPLPDVTEPLPAETETETATETETEAVTVVPVGVRFDREEAVDCFTYPSATAVTLVEDASEGAVIQLTITQQTSDPNISLNYNKYARQSDGDRIDLEDYPIIVFRIKNISCTSPRFPFFWITNEARNLTDNYSGDDRLLFDNSLGEWTYAWADMSDHENWKGTLQSIRLDWQSPTPAGEVVEGTSLYISGIWFVKSVEEAKILTGLVEDPFEQETDPEIEAKVDELLATADPAPEVPNDKLTAAQEDANLNLWFNHSYTKTSAEDVTPTDMNTYVMRLAKNEAESCHMLLASLVGHNGVTVSLTDFTNAAGATLKTELLYGYYFDDVEGMTVPDPIPWVNKSFDLQKDRSQMFIIKVTTGSDAAAGLYEAYVTVKNADGQEIKKAKVSAYVWNFALPDASSCKTQMDLGWYAIYVTHDCPEGDDGLLYKNYYDFLLEHRVNAYTLPYLYDANDVYLGDERVMDYIDNPRVVAFNPLGWKKDPTPHNVSAAYALFSQKQEWLDKCYFYPVDEPQNVDDLNRVNYFGSIIKENFPGYKMIIPTDTNETIGGDPNMDKITYMQEYMNVYCVKPFWYTTFAQYNYDRRLTYTGSPLIEETLGTWAERMAIASGNGQEVWWYVVHEPDYPETTLVIDTEAVRYRILFWQQKLYNVDSFLYYAVNDWANYQMFTDDKNGVDKKHEDYPEFECYGNGVLLYCGQQFDVYGPVGSLRLECVRDGIEDFEYLTMLTEIYGEETVDAIICRITTSITRYTTDEELFTEIRVALGNILEKALNA